MTYAFRRVGQVALGVHVGAPPTEREWAGWLRLLADHPPTERIRVLIEMLTTGTPDARQRQQLQQVTKAYTNADSVVFTDSLMTRGVITAVSWLGVPVRAFSFHEYPVAVSYLGLDEGELVQVRAALEALRAEAGATSEVRETMRAHMASLPSCHPPIR